MYQELFDFVMKDIELIYGPGGSDMWKLNLNPRFILEEFYPALEHLYREDFKKELVSIWWKEIKERG